VSIAGFRSTGIVGAMTLLSRVLGLLREVVYAQTFGAGALMDAFLVAFKIPNFLRRLFAEGAFAHGFVPVVSEYRQLRTPSEVRALVSGTVGTLGALLFGVTLVGVLAAPLLVLIFAPGFERTPDKFAQTVVMLRLTFPYLFFISLTALFGGVLNSYGRFALPALTQSLMSVVMIAFAALLAPHSAHPGTVLAAGVFVSGCVQLVFQLPLVARLGLLGRPRWGASLEGVRRVGGLMLPGIIGSSTAQVSLLIDTLIASFLATGSISWLYFADRLLEFPLGIFGIALATVILPALSAQHARAAQEHFAATLDWALRVTLLVVTPCALGLLLFAGPIVATVYGRGAFAARDVNMTQLALMAYAAGLLGMSLVKVLAPGYFARQDTRTPMRIGLASLAVNVLINVLVVVPAARLGFSAPHALLAVSTSIAALVNTALLWRGLRSAGVYRPLPGWRKLLARLAGANAAMALLLLWLRGDPGAWVAMPGSHRIGRCLACIGAAALIYAASLGLLGMRFADYATGPQRAG
jgi:putative peptidoglycan lipid II flippase